PVPGLRHPLHARDPAGRAHGVHRGRLLRLPPVRARRGPAVSAADLAKGLACPVPLPADAGGTVLLGHGGGGRMTQQLIERVFLQAFRNPALEPLHDGATLPVMGGRLAFSTDAFVVRPLFFPGGNIGSLAVHGTVNDLAMCGARPLALSASFILEEGFPMAD